MIRSFLSIIVCLLSLSLIAQNDSVLKNLLLKDGIYFSFNEFIKQKPVVFQRIITDQQTFNEDFFKRKIIQYIDDYGMVKSIDTKNIWGYVLNNALFVYYGKEFYRVSYIGTLSHFMASQTIRNYVNSYDPFYGYYSPFPVNSYETTNIVQLILDMRTGKIYPFSYESLLALITDDKELFEEYSLLKKRKKKELIFYYLRKYNERHPFSLTN